MTVERDGTVVFADEASIPEYATALEIVFKYKFLEVPTLDKRDDYEYIAKFIVGPFVWDESTSNY